ncbi:hypothetical protein P8452_43893 [Trifolium repens]|nr:hypothetical protein P8452_43893 [Trifolium repens]
MMNTLNQIWEWVMKPEVWTFIGCASAVVGLVCYALSSSFDHLFGNWNLLKKILYSLFSFIISLIMLFAYKWTHSISPWFKVIANIAKALVITLGALYSFYLEKKVEGKPDAYSLISYAAFTIMSLSLLLQSRGRFGKELMEFFVACLIVEFMKIKPIFFLLGACFYYSIFAVFFSQIEAESHSNINVTANQPSTELGSNIGNEVSTSLLDSNIIVTVNPRSTQLASTIDNEDSTSLLDSNINVTADLHLPELASTNSGSIMLDCEKAVKALREETSTLIEMLIEKLKDYLSGDSGFSGFNVSEDTNLMIMALPTKTMDNIQRIADLMVRSGFKMEFSDVYSSSRSECLIESLSRLGFEKLSIEHLQMLSWKEIEDETERWIKAITVAFKILFPVERKLCNRIYFGFVSTADLLFMDVCRESRQQLLNFAEVIAHGSGLAEPMTSIIKVNETMRDLIIPEFKYLFCDQYIGSLPMERFKTMASYIRFRGKRKSAKSVESKNMIIKSIEYEREIRRNREAKVYLDLTGILPHLD